jgi:hypothetical protein
VARAELELLQELSTAYGWLLGAPNLAILRSIRAIILFIASYIALRASMRSLLVGLAMVVTRID